jgi:hypothetical protein
MTTLAFIFHIGAGSVALIAGAIAIFARKGGPLHRRAGTVFFYAMLVMAVFAGWLAVVQPGQIVNLFISVFVLYLVVTAWLTVQRKEGETGAAEKAALAVAIVLCAPFVILSIQLAFHLPLLVKSAVPLEGPVLIAIYAFTAVLVIAALGDARVAFAGGIRGAPRIARHLWRMCVALTLATGSAFTNGFARFLPGPYHVPVAFFLPQFVPLLLLVFWMIRVRLTGWYRDRVAAEF